MKVVNWGPLGTSSFWVLLPELNATTSIVAAVGNPSVGEATRLLQERKRVEQVHRGGLAHGRKKKMTRYGFKGQFSHTPIISYT